MKKTAKTVACILAAAVMLTGCGSSSVGKADKDLNSLTMDELIKGAQAEGKLESVGMPEGWANWEGSWKTYTEKYGIEHLDTDMSSAEELSTFEAEKDSPTKDMGDVGQAFGQIAIDKDLVQGYKPTTWDSIPDWAKDPQGRWIISYLGTMSTIVNKDLTAEEPKSWQDIKNGTIKVTVGDVVRGASSQMAVLSAAYAMGGGVDNVKPGIELFKELARQGRIDLGALSQQRFAMGEIQLGLNWDYNVLSWRDATLETNPGAKIATHVLADGAVQSGYCLVFNKYAPHPHATALAIEYLLSDEGQIDRARGYAKPIRSDVVIPDDVAARLIDTAEYEKAIPITDTDALTEACNEIATLWEEEVIPLLG
ncbi:MAG: ABC transporter substrate-binding protein [Peptococcaceae bacterium]|nr:ABC transporter substrate-binding protein [Peptococcaceae bacterium]